MNASPVPISIATAGGVPFKIKLYEIPICDPLSEIRVLSFEQIVSPPNTSKDNGKAPTIMVISFEKLIQLVVKSVPITIIWSPLTNPQVSNVFNGPDCTVSLFTKKS